MQIDVYTEPEPLSGDISLRIYSNPICPYVQRVRLLVAEKGIKSEEINIHLKVKPDWYLEKINPVGKVPTIQHNGNNIPESLIAFAYIDEVFGESVWPKDPYLRAKDRLFVNDFDSKFIPSYYKHYRKDSVSEKDTEEVVKFVTRMEELLGSQNYLSSQTDKPGAADFICWPWIERLEPLRSFNTSLGGKLNKEKFPNFFNYITRMLQSDPVKKTSLSTEVHLKFLNALTTTGKHDYGVVDTTGQGVVIYTKKE